MGLKWQACGTIYVSPVFSAPRRCLRPRKVFLYHVTVSLRAYGWRIRSHFTQQPWESQFIADLKSSFRNFQTEVTFFKLFFVVAKVIKLSIL